MSQQSMDPHQITASDIVFECPVCRKSLAIDQRGLGLVISCPECGEPLQVPAPPRPEVGAEELVVRTHDPGIHQQGRFDRLAQEYEELNGRRQSLERMRTDTLSRFERIQEELSVIQSAIDRIVTIIQEASTRNP